MLKHAQRLRRRSDFAKLHRFGSVQHAKAFTLKYRANNLPSTRVAVVVSTKVSKRAVLRNRTRRRFYAAFRELWPQMEPGYDIAVLARQPALDLRGQELHEQLASCLKRAGVLH